MDPGYFLRVALSFTPLQRNLVDNLKMSYADCYAAALAKLRRADLVTGDRDFKQVEGEMKVMWI